MFKMAVIGKPRWVKINPADPNTVMSANTANVFTPIFTHTIPLGIQRELISGTMFRIKLLKSDSTEIDRDSQILICSQAPEDTLPKELYKFPYSPFHALSLADQLDANKYRTQLSINTPIPRYIFRQQTKLIIQLRSPDVIDPTKSVIEFSMIEYPVTI